LLYTNATTKQKRKIKEKIAGLLVKTVGLGLSLPELQKHSLTTGVLREPLWPI